MDEPTSKKQARRHEELKAHPQERSWKDYCPNRRWTPGWISWSQFTTLPGITKAIIENVYYATDGEGWFSRATIKLLQRHGVRGVYAPGACPS